MSKKDLDSTHARRDDAQFEERGKLADGGETKGVDYLGVVEKAKNLKPSKRGELEITDLNRLYLEEERLSLKMMGRGMAWLDTGTHDSLLEASNFIATIENRQGLKVACLEEIAYRYGYISREKLLQLAEPLKKNNYGAYLIKIANEKQVYNID